MSVIDGGVPAPLPLPGLESVADPAAALDPHAVDIPADADASASASVTASVAAGASTPVLPPKPRALCRAVRGRSEVTEENVAIRADLSEDAVRAEALRRIHRRRRGAAAMLYVEEMKDVALLWDEKAGDEGDYLALAAGVALRARLGQATYQLRRAHMGVPDLPLSLEKVATGDLPTRWFDDLLRAVERLSSAQRHRVDAEVAGWELATLSPDRFRTLVRLLVTWVDEVAALGPTAEETRDVSLDHSHIDDGTATLTVTGPAPEILDLAKRLDAAAHAIQDQQRHALARIAAGETGVEIPWDLHGQAARTGKRLPLGAIRYLLLTRGEIDTQGVPVPAAGVRLNLVVPVLSLLGRSDAPATLEGTIPIPAGMARELAAQAPSFQRVLTDPITGEFLPVASTTYRPTAAMREHVLLIDPVCAVPGCERHIAESGEVDHVEEFDHLRPENGGPTMPHNLHGLCWSHHDAKTERYIDPERSGDGKRTRWNIGGLTATEVTTNRDLVTQSLAESYSRYWDDYVQRRRAAEERARARAEAEAAAAAAGTGADPGADAPPGDGDPDHAPPF
ncbi:HNH endonuclease signature motif containing protein [Brachybacterium horti]